jgi:hypothetical protein
VKPTLSHLKGKYFSFLNSDDLHDPELSMIRSRMVGGTHVLWAEILDPYVTIHAPTTSAFTALILQVPGYQVTIHIALYLPTSGRDQEFVSELSNLRICLTELTEQYPTAVLYIRGDSNVNKNNKSRVLLLKQLMENFSLLRVNIPHQTYHHFVGQGLHDSNIDVLLHSDKPGVGENLVTILCKHDHPDMLSHHDIILSECSFPAMSITRQNSDNPVTAPRLLNTRKRIVWSAEGITKYEELISPRLRLLREAWLDPSSTACMSVILQMTNHALSNTAGATNKAVSLSTLPAPRPASTPRPVRSASQRLNRAHKAWKRAKHCGKDLLGLLTTLL